MTFRLCAEVLLLGLLLFLCPSAFSQDAMHLFHKMQGALGGAGKIVEAGGTKIKTLGQSENRPC
jgi:hypothetical protein